ncbi:hypothetical protein GDO78_020682, partial [Eleutherodactylus coqui]
FAGACGPPPVIANTLQPEETSGVAGDTVVYRCNRTAGYYESPGKSNTITCQGDDTWSTLPEFCERACGVPEGLPYATVKPEDLEKDIFLPGANVRYDCRLGYIRAPGTNTITCLADYTWSTPSEFCVRKSCGHPDEPVNGEIDSADDFLFGSRVTYKCNDGYHLVGRRPYRDCQADGTWTNQVPQCEVTICAAPEQPANGAYDPVKDEYNYLDAVSFRCNKDFHVIGVSTVSCTSNGSWSADSPTCKGVSCPDPGPLQNGRRESGFVGPYTLNSAVTFQCNDNFIMNGSRKIGKMHPVMKCIQVIIKGKVLYRGLTLCGSVMYTTSRGKRTKVRSPAFPIRHIIEGYMQYVSVVVYGPTILDGYSVLLAGITFNVLVDRRT